MESTLPVFPSLRPVDNSAAESNFHPIFLRVVQRLALPQIFPFRQQKPRTLCLSAFGHPTKLPLVYRLWFPQFSLFTIRTPKLQLLSTHRLTFPQFPLVFTIRTPKLQLLSTHRLTFPQFSPLFSPTEPPNYSYCQLTGCPFPNFPFSPTKSSSSPLSPNYSYCQLT